MRMRIITALFICCFAVSNAVMAAEKAIGQIISLEGLAKATGVDNRERDLALKAEVFLNDRIVTPVGSKLQIRFSDDTVISQGEKSEMTIDQYIYSPGAKQDVNCSLKMMRGVFRAITGKITEMNPERFKVKTNLATIGIRGCELGFRLQPNREDVYVINLPPGHSIIMEKIIADEAGKGGVLGAGDRVLRVVNDGVAVTISASASLVERSFTPAEGRQLMQDSTPAGAAGSGGGSAGGDNITASQMKDKVDAIRALAKSEGDIEKPSPSPAPAKNDDTAEFVQPTEAPYVPPPTNSPPVLVGGAPMNTWEWGVWADGSVQSKPNRAFGYEFLSAAEYAAIVAATPSRILNGSGDAGAAIIGPGYRNTITGVGGVTFQVLVGNSVTPAWGGTFLLTGGGDSLSFSVDRPSGGGKIDASGALTLNPLVPLASYSLTANGTTYNQGSLTAQGVNGRLIKANPPAAPDINGVTGSFNFQHGSSVRVSGAFGADLF